MKARIAIVATLCVVSVLNACGDPTNLRASLPTGNDTLSVFALSGTPPSFPSGISIIARQAVRVDGFAGFDVAFDIDPTGKPVIYPVRLIVSSPGGTRAVGMQRVSGLFDSVTVAPKTGYHTDSSFVLGLGEVVAIESPHNSSGDLCGFAISPNIYAKFAVDSVNLNTRTLFVRMGVDPNCGFRSFVEGIPTG
jgi:hypothetical protein